MWKVTNQSESSAEILLYDEIANFYDEDWGFISAKALINKVKAFGNIKNITLRINSVGGDLGEALAMYNYFRMMPADITVLIDGLAASAATLVAMAGNKIIMPSNALMMIHNPSGRVWGEAEDMRDTAEILDKYRDILVNAYAIKTGQPKDKLITMMDAETWMTATEAYDLKFCDEVSEAVEITAKAVKGGKIFMNGFGFARIDEFLSTKLPINYVQNKTSPKPKDELKEDKTEMEIKNAAELEQAYPELVADIRNTAINTERERLRTLDSLNAPGRDEIIAKAKYEDPKDARDIAIELLQAEKTQAQLDALHNDASAVNGALPPSKDTPQAKADEEAAINAVARELNRMRGFNNGR